ncbi:MAG TPA: Rid family detoxifying hydrolase [Actinomycetota bacterium]|nr:Rid family detoxifying hydrolase [Actinomycetota bacterium]
MTRDARQPEGLPRPTSPYSPVVVGAGLAFISGQVALDASGRIVPGGIAEQTRQVLTNLRACLEAAGATMDDVVKVTAFLADLGDFAAFNEEYAGHFAEPRPARSTVEVGLAAGLLVEIEAVAVLPT